MAWLGRTSITPIMALRLEEHRPVIIALDGQPCKPHEPPDGRISLGPAMRAHHRLRTVRSVDTRGRLIRSRANQPLTSPSSTGGAGSRGS
ncbi:MAG TPA: hypothetical protein VFE41_30835, partial [Acetobacteraceae bacterium]|nr:hypothetical protein [Acetobacteraceae bacterium]